MGCASPSFQPAGVAPAAGGVGAWARAGPAIARRGGNGSGGEQTAAAKLFFDGHGFPFGRDHATSIAAHAAASISSWPGTT